MLGQDPGPGREARAGDAVDVRVSQGEERAAVPDVIGQEEGNAIEILANAGFRVSRIREPNNSFPRGVVFDQDPPPRQPDGSVTEAPPGSMVTIFVSEGPQTFPMPNVIGETEEDAVAQLEESGLRVRVVHVFAPDQEGRVIDQDPNPGVTVRRGQLVEIQVGRSS